MPSKRLIPPIRGFRSSMNGKSGDMNAIEVAKTRWLDGVAKIKGDGEERVYHHAKVSFIFGTGLIASEWSTNLKQEIATHESWNAAELMKGGLEGEVRKEERRVDEEKHDVAREVEHERGEI
jgi:hypothetical protein